MKKLKADLCGADLCVANLRGADLIGATWHGLEIDRLPSGKFLLIPTPDEWVIKLGCWAGTPNELRELIAKDAGWPQAKGDQIPHRRKYIEAALTLADLHMLDHADYLDALKNAWNTETTDQTKR